MGIILLLRDPGRTLIYIGRLEETEKGSLKPSVHLAQHFRLIVDGDFTENGDPLVSATQSHFETLTSKYDMCVIFNIPRSNP